MVVGLALAAVQMGMALPTGFLFGVGYGTGVRIGYEQVYPLLFPKGARSTTSELAATMKGMNTVYDAIGGKDASRMGIAVGITNAGEILNNPDFQVLEKLESSLSGPTSSNLNRSRFGLDQAASLSPQESLSKEIQEFNLSTGAPTYTKYRKLSISQLVNIIEFPISKESTRIANAVLQEKLASGGGAPTVVSPLLIPNKPPVVTKAILAAKEPIALRWLANRDKNIINLKSTNANLRASAKTKLLQQSNQYRDPNEFIRTQALILRKLIAGGLLK